MQNESGRSVARRVWLLAALLLSGPPHVLAASADAPAATTAAAGAATEPASGTGSAPTSTAAPAAESAQSPKPTNDSGSKEPEEFNPSESLSEDATVAYPVDI